MTNLALLLQPLDNAERLFHRDLGIDAVKLPQLDTLDLQSPQAHLHLLVKVFRPGHWKPAIRPLPRKASLRCDYDALRVGASASPISRSLTSGRRSQPCR